MVVAAALAVALLPPPADVAMSDGLGISPFGSGFHGLLQRAPDDAVIRRERRQPVGFRREAGARPDDMEEFRLNALQFREKLRIQAELEDGFRLRVTRELAVHGFIGPAAAAGFLFDAQQHVGAAPPRAASETGLDDDLDAAFHRG